MPLKMLRSVGQRVTRLLPVVCPTTHMAKAAVRVIEGRSVTKVLYGVGRIQGITTCKTMRCEVAEEEEGEGEKKEDNIPPEKNRRQIIPVETSIKYMQSDAYKTTYGDEPVWVKYRRNFKGGLPPTKTRKTCIRDGILATGNPCPVCRDEFLVVEYRNLELIKQFISPFNGAVLPPLKTNICQKQHRRLLVAVNKARDYGLLTYDVPHRHYDYSEYYQPQQQDGTTEAGR
ncbi:hypothetical protein Pcinc_036227 [Petrolisthes cinctipes]|uniref:Small ribosomal subunit protein mS40 n=1 Tax=Petrolisthes cinctipes TaxID=88211 RepID=A0AAE1EMS8_PETCI|nr:hypothetical protein Pcinc_036227 [Petrolisthes cinctipes]